MIAPNVRTPLLGATLPASPIHQGVDAWIGSQAPASRTASARVLALVGRRLTNAEIAAELFISVRTVESHVSSLLTTPDVANRRALSAVAREWRA